MDVRLSRLFLCLCARLNVFMTLYACMYVVRNARAFPCIIATIRAHHHRHRHHRQQDEGG